MKKALLACLAAGVIEASAAIPQAYADVLHIVTDQGAREAIVLPFGQAPAPTVIVLHGATITAAMTARGSGFAQAAAARGFAAVFPQGIDRQWNDGREGRTSSVDDVGFLRRLVDDLGKRRISDPARISIAGISNGGMMTFRMLCEASELFASAATIIANMPSGIGERCTLRKRVPIVMFNGTADPLVPYKGGGVGLAGGRGKVWGTEETAQFMARASGCEAPVETAPSASEASPGPVRVTRLDWSRCRSGQSVTLYRFEGGGHQVPGGPNLMPGLLGPGTEQVRAAETSMLFLSR